MENLHLGFSQAFKRGHFSEIPCSKQHIVSFSLLYSTFHCWNSFSYFLPLSTENLQPLQASDSNQTTSQWTHSTLLSHIMHPSAWPLGPTLLSSTLSRHHRCLRPYMVKYFMLLEASGDSCMLSYCTSDLLFGPRDAGYWGMQPVTLTLMFMLMLLPLTDNTYNLQLNLFWVYERNGVVEPSCRVMWGPALLGIQGQPSSVFITCANVNISLQNTNNNFVWVLLLCPSLEQG